MSSITRRAAIGAGTAFALAGAAHAQPVAAAVRVRRNAGHMTPDDPDLAAYIRGMRAMRQRADTVSWGQQVFIHSGDWGQHGGWRFLPWHRAQLYWFERLIAKFSGKADFAMPYWDWQTTPVLPAWFTDPKGPLYHRRRRDDLAGVDYAKSRVDSGFDTWANLFQDSFSTFAGEVDTAGSVESSGHGFVHVTTGGDMGDTSTAPKDPLFWFHHCNVDRVWATWQPMAETRHVTPEPAWLDERFDNFVDETGAKASVMTTRDVLKTEALGYRYDAAYPLPWFDEQLVRPPAGKTKREVVANHDFKVALTDTPGADGALRVPLPPDITAILIGDRSGTGFALKGHGRVRLAGEKMCGTVVRIGVRRIAAAGVALTPMATVLPFVGGHGAAASAEHPGMDHAAMAAPAAQPAMPHQHGFAFAIGPQLFDATGFNGVLEVEVEAAVAWAPVIPALLPPARMTDPPPPPAPEPQPPMPTPLITALNLDLTLVEYRWT
jgi:hypothetical protein